MTRPDFSIRAYPVLGILEVHDGDTFRMNLDVGFEADHFPWLRLKDYSCPELSDPGGLDARNTTFELLREHLPTLWVETFKAHAGWADMSKSFARYLAAVHLSDTLDLGTELVRLGHAKPGARVG
jgi:endonuclease YncB( thermonuclease family)